MAYLGQEPGQGQAERWLYTATGSGTVVSASDSGATLGYTLNQISVYLNGVKQVIGAGKDVVASNGSTIVFASAYASGDVIEIIALSVFTAADSLSASTGGTVGGQITSNSFQNLSTMTTAFTIDNLKSGFICGAVTIPTVTVNGHLSVSTSLNVTTGLTIGSTGTLNIIG